jgi:cytoskeletal protein CcmA (bactofilin family)
MEGDRVFNRRKPEDAKPASGAPEPSVPDSKQSDFLRTPEPRSEPTQMPEDNGLDVPPFRPVPPDFSQVTPVLPKETQMARSPFSPNLPPPPSTVLRPPAAGMPGPRETNGREAGERRTLVVGRGISVQGTVQDAERLVVEGTVEAAMINGLAELSIANGGIFKGEVEVDEAEVAGTIDGALTARNTLIIRATCRVLGTARCRRLQVEDGGQMTGRIEMLGDAPAPVAVEGE